MRARCALLYSGIEYEHREIELKNKPRSMLNLSPKGTVPVLLTEKNEVIDQSIEIMYWALAQNDPDHWLPGVHSQNWQMMQHWIEINDGRFKQLLDIYKYPQRHPLLNQQQVIDEAHQIYFNPLITLLEGQRFLLGDRLSMLDIALFPFVRQWLAVDSKKIHLNNQNRIEEWLNFFVLSDLFHKVMAKYPLWREAE